MSSTGCISGSGAAPTGAGVSTSGALAALGVPVTSASALAAFALSALPVRGNAPAVAPSAILEVKRASASRVSRSFAAAARRLSCSVMGVL